MAKNIRLKQEHIKTDFELLQSLHRVAEKYNNYVEKRLLFIYKGKNECLDLECYEVVFRKDNFIHLVGCKKGIINANSFFDKCLNGSINIHEITFKENRKVSSSKIDALFNLLDYKYVKIYKIGEKDLISEKNDFEIGLGNNNALIGFDHRIRGSQLAIPVTTLSRSINDFVSEPHSLLAVLSKNSSHEKYNTIIGKISNKFSLITLPDHVKNKIDKNLLENLKS